MTSINSASDNNSLLRVAVIGCGAIGQRRHIPESAANPHVKLVALCDPHPGRAEDVARRFNVPATYLDHKEMLAKERPDVVAVCTPNALHARHTMDALEVGCHVLVEKPMAATVAEANAMIAAAEKAGKQLMVGMNQRLMPAHVKAKKILDSGVLGRPLNFQTSFKHGGPDGWSVDGVKSWFFKKELAAMGVCGDLGVHKVDLMAHLLGQRITEVGGFIGTLSKKLPGATSLIEVDDTAFLTVKTSEGVIGVVTVTWTHYGHAEDNGTTIYCENGVIEIGTRSDFSVVVHFRDGSKEFYQTGATATNQKQTNSGVMDAFVDALRNNRRPPITGQDGREGLRVILGAFDAAASGKRVMIA